MEAIPSVHHLISGAIDSITKWLSPANKLDFPTRRHFYYALVRTLHGGSEATTTTYSARPPLSLELVIQILWDAECTVLSRLSRHVGKPIGEEVHEMHEMSLSGIIPHFFPAPDLANRRWSLPSVNDKGIDFWTETETGTGGMCDPAALGISPIRHDWFSTAPLSARDLANTHSMQLLTLKGDRVWFSDPYARSWSWFDVVLLPSEGERVNAEEHSWSSHSIDPPASTIRLRAGSIFGPSHEIWQITQIGDRIGVRAYACDQLSGWESVATMTVLVLHEYFTPSFVPQ